MQDNTKNKMIPINTHLSFLMKKENDNY